MEVSHHKCHTANYLFDWQNIGCLVFKMTAANANPFGYCELSDWTKLKTKCQKFTFPKNGSQRPFNQLAALPFISLRNMPNISAIISLCATSKSTSALNQQQAKYHKLFPSAFPPPSKICPKQYLHLWGATCTKHTNIYFKLNNYNASTYVAASVQASLPCAVHVSRAILQSDVHRNQCLSN